MLAILGLAMLVTGLLNIIWSGLIFYSNWLTIAGAVIALIGIVILSSKG